MDSPQDASEWPRRWHQIVAEYNTSFERQQDRMRTRFEEQFDHIRRENEASVREFRVQRDILAGSICEALNQVDDTEDRIAFLATQISNCQTESSDLDRQIQSLEKLNLKLNHDLSQQSGLSDEREKRRASMLEDLSLKKALLRDEIRDLKGFLKMNSRLSESPENVGGTIIASTVKSASSRRKRPHTSLMLRHTVRRLTESTVRKPLEQSELLLEKFAQNSGNQKLSIQLSEYIRAKQNYDELLEKYEIFTPKQTSTKDAARSVGLQLPKSIPWTT